MRIPTETYSACDFPGGLDLCPHPLWAHPCCLRVAESTHFTCILIVRWYFFNFIQISIENSESKQWRP